MGKKKRAKKEKIPIPSVPIKQSSPLGWIVLLGPLCIVSFALLFGKSIPFLKEQAAVEAEDAAEMVCRAAEDDIRSGNYQSAYSRLMYALQIKPDYADAYINLGKIYYLSGDIPTAINWLQKAVSLDLPQKDLVFNNLGLLYAQQGEYQTALAMFERALATGLSLEQIYSN
ncbi:MAG TPA: tetratricopeptide repeat protein, partial [Bacteroidetes bacterium]|nr:tetratricopeptide repeat protein [Bacteroidota bacterium]